MLFQIIYQIIQDLDNFNNIKVLHIYYIISLLLVIILLGIGLSYGMYRN